MRRRVAIVAAAIVTTIVGADAASARHAPGATRAHRAARARTPLRSPFAFDGPASAFECDTPRGAHAFGSTARCLRALCADANRVNAYVLDGAERLRRNPCVAIDHVDEVR